VSSPGELFRCETFRRAVRAVRDAGLGQLVYGLYLIKTIIESTTGVHRNVAG
jgi:hypothetical protein